MFHVVKGRGELECRFHGDTELVIMTYFVSQPQGRDKIDMIHLQLSITLVFLKKVYSRRLFS